MADATVTLGLDASGVSSGLKKATAEVNSFSNRIQSSPLGRSRGGQTGSQISYQLQDIAVQAQMGTNALTIFSQQAPQLLSALGGGQLAALSGAVAAIGGALVYAGYKGSEAVKGLIQDASSLDAEIGKLTSGGSLSQMEGAFERILAKQEEIRQSAAKMAPGTFGGFTRELASLIGFGEGGYKQDRQAAASSASLEKTKVQLSSKLIETSAKNLEIAKLRANGENSTADAMERQAKLEARIAEIKGSQMDDYTKGRLIQDAYELSEIQEKQKTKTFDIAKNIQEQANAANSILAPYKEFLDFLDDAKRKQDAIDDKKDADRKATQSKIEGQKEAAQALQDEIDLLTVRATGDEKAIRDAEAALAIKQRARQIQRDMNVDAKTSMGIAQQIASLEQKGKKGSGADTDGDGFISKREQRKSDLEQKRGQRKADSIKGFSRDQKGLSAFGGLREFYGMQVDREWTGRGSVGSRFAETAYGKTARHITSAGIKDRADDFAKSGMQDYMIPLLKAVEQLNTTMTDKLTVD